MRFLPIWGLAQERDRYVAGASSRRSSRLTQMPVTLR